MALQRIHQQRLQRLQRLQPFTAQTVARLPQRHQGLQHLRAVTALMVGFLGPQCLRWIHALRWFRAIQPLQQGFTVVTGEPLQRIEQPPLSGQG